MSTKSKSNGLGHNPLAGLFDRTENTVKVKRSQQFLQDIDGHKESVGLQLPFDVNDWLNSVVEEGRRNRIRKVGTKIGKPITKQVWVWAAVELLQSAPIDWSEIESVDELRDVLTELAEKLQQQ